MEARSVPPGGDCCNSLRSSSPSDLSQSIFIHIMLMLPLQTIMVCKCVCKIWLGMLSDPWFANQYINTSPCDDFMCLGKGEVEGERLVVLGSCNGLVLYGYESCPTLFVQNPIVENNILITIPPDTGEEEEEEEEEKEYTSSFECTYGIGHCVHSGKYKVVKIKQLSTNVTKAKLYVVGDSSNSWRSIQSYPPRSEWWNHAGVFIGGSLYWFITQTDGNNCRSGSICCLDMETEKFHILEPPPPLERFKAGYVVMWPTEQGVWCFRESGLRIFKHGNSILVSFCNFGNDGRIWKVWIMKQYGVKESWVLDFVFQNHMPYEIYPLAIVSNDEFILTSLLKGGLFTYYRGNNYLGRLIDYDKGMFEHAVISSPLSPKHL